MTRTSAYVVVSSPTDAHIPFVEKHLDQPFVVLDWTQIPAGTPASYILGKQGFGLEWDGRRLDRVASVWFRKPYKIEAKNLPIAPELAAYAAGSLQQFNDLLLAHFDSALWISDYYAMRRALNKTLQLTVAQRLGFAVPDTLITASPRAAQAFVERQRATIVKPIDVQLFRAGREDRLFLAQKVDRASIDYAGLPLSPAIFQQAIDVLLDIRVTVVGDRLFAAAVTGSAIDNNSSNIRDWRIVHHEGDMIVKPFDLPKKIAGLCIAHVRELGLKFGAIDLVLDKKRKYWFLENNPNGQWAFVEAATGQPIGKAIAELLVKG